MQTQMSCWKCRGSIPVPRDFPAEVVCPQCGERYHRYDSETHRGYEKEEPKPEDLKNARVRGMIEGLEKP